MAVGVNHGAILRITPDEFSGELEGLLKIGLVKLLKVLNGCWFWFIVTVTNSQQSAANTQHPTAINQKPPIIFNFQQKF